MTDGMSKVVSPFCRLNTSLRNMRDVYQTACQLKFHKVAQYCSDHLMKHISVSNCVGEN